MRDFVNRPQIPAPRLLDKSLRRCRNWYISLLLVVAPVKKPSVGPAQVYFNQLS
jgi:hypothetical protein